MTQPQAGSETRGFTVTRVFDAPREAVWTAWTTREGFAQWFGLEGSGLQDVKMDVRPGGSWSATMIIPEAPSIPWSGAYLEVVEPERLVLTLNDTNDASNTQDDVVTVTLNDLGGRTEMVMNQTGHLPPEMYERTIEGWNVFFDRLAASLPAA